MAVDILAIPGGNFNGIPLRRAGLDFDNGVRRVYTTFTTTVGAHALTTRFTAAISSGVWVCTYAHVLSYVTIAGAAGNGVSQLYTDADGDSWILAASHGAIAGNGMSIPASPLWVLQTGQGFGSDVINYETFAGGGGTFMLSGSAAMVRLD